MQVFVRDNDINLASACSSGRCSARECSARLRRGRSYEKPTERRSREQAEELRASGCSAKGTAESPFRSGAELFRRRVGQPVQFVETAGDQPPATPILRALGVGEKRD